MRPRPLTFTVLLLAAILALAVAPTAGASPRAVAVCEPVPRVVRDVHYDAIDGVDPNLLALDLYLPSTGAACPRTPVVVGVHGGAWRFGDKRGFVDDKAALFNGKGWVYASVNYRLTLPAVQPTVMYPTHNRDVAHAVAWIVDHAKRYRLDPERVGLFGHSAGAGIVAAIATDELFLEDAGLGLDAVRCAFPDDTESFDVAARIAAGGLAERIYRQVFGDDPATWEEASPLSHVERGKAIPPMLLTRRGEATRVAQLEQFADTLRDVGVDVEVIDATGYSHMDVNRLIGSTDDPVMTAPVSRFFEGCFEPT